MNPSSKYVVPPAAEWTTILRQVDEHAAGRSLIPPLSLDELGAEADVLLRQDHLPPDYRSFLAVMLGNAVWKDMVAAVPFDKRTLLLPPCLRSTSACRASFDEYGLLCLQCGRCAIGPAIEKAESLGYAVLVAEGTDVVSALIRQEAIEAVVGVSCMPALERTFPALAFYAIPGLAIPLLADGCKDTQVLADRLGHFIHLAPASGASYCLDMHALREAVAAWFQPAALAELLHAGASETDRISLEWLAAGGKRWRPFLLASVYSALTQTRAQNLPPAIRSLAVAVECLHKASLAFDDIQDNDAVRYGQPTLHAKWGVPIGLNAGLLLVGWGYRLIAECGASPAQVAEMTALAAHGHCDLCLGQGTELLWTRQPKSLVAAEILDLFSLKTSPPFEVATRLAAVMANAAPGLHGVLRDYSRAMGIAYQIRDDLDDVDDGNDRQAGRPSIVLATAGANGSDLTPARDLLRQYQGDALRSLAPLRNAWLKTLLHRVVGLAFKPAAG